MDYNHIFNFSYEDGCIYCGVFSGILKAPGSPKEYLPELIAFVAIDENKDYLLKVRIKFPSGNKLAYEENMGKNPSEKSFLDILNVFDYISLDWLPNPSGTLKDLLSIMKENDMIDSCTLVVGKDD